MCDASRHTQLKNHLGNWDWGNNHLVSGTTSLQPSCARLGVWKARSWSNISLPLLKAPREWYLFISLPQLFIWRVKSPVSVASECLYTLTDVLLFFFFKYSKSLSQVYRDKISFRVLLTTTSFLYSLNEVVFHSTTQIISAIQGTDLKFLLLVHQPEVVFWNRDHNVLITHQKILR